MDNRLVLLRTTYATEEDARSHATRLVDARLVACARVQPLWSAYRWKGQVASGEEWQVEVHARPQDRDAAWAAMLDGHPYETPCVEVVGESMVPAPYMRWAERVTKRP